MREIKFRVWSKSRQEMIYPDKNGWFHKVYVADNGYLQDIQLGVAVDLNGSKLELQQYTGLKDKNGIEIYEGDIVKGKNYGFNNPIRYIGTVEYVYNKFKVIGCRNKYKGTNDELSTIYEVIGNIYENPELVQS